MKKIMSLYEAILYKKKLEDRLDRLNNNDLSFVDILYKKTNQSKDGKSEEESKQMIQSSVDSSVSLCNNFINVKAAINEANAKITISVAGKTYTIANAIVRHRLIEQEREIYTRMLHQFANARKAIEHHNTVNLSSDNVSEYVSKILGNVKASNDLIDDTSKRYIEDNEVYLYDPMGVQVMAERKLEELSKFEEEIHFALTKANCENSIEVDISD